MKRMRSRVNNIVHRFVITQSSFKAAVFLFLIRWQHRYKSKMTNKRNEKEPRNKSTVIIQLTLVAYEPHKKNCRIFKICTHITEKECGAFISCICTKYNTILHYPELELMFVKAIITRSSLEREGWRKKTHRKTIQAPTERKEKN